MARRYRFDAGESDHESEADEPIGTRPTNRGGRNKKRQVKKRVKDDWSDGSEDDDDDEEEDDEEVIDDFKEDDSGVDMAESLVGSQFSLLATGKALKVDNCYHRNCCLTSPRPLVAVHPPPAACFFVASLFHVALLHVCFLSCSGTIEHIIISILCRLCFICCTH